MNRSLRSTDGLLLFLFFGARGLVLFGKFVQLSLELFAQFLGVLFLLFEDVAVTGLETA
jgi:hypothetical protein